MFNRNRRRFRQNRRHSVLNSSRRSWIKPYLKWYDLAIDDDIANIFGYENVEEVIDEFQATFGVVPEAFLKPKEEYLDILYYSPYRILVPTSNGKVLAVTKNFRSFDVKSISEIEDYVYEELGYEQSGSEFTGIREPKKKGFNCSRLNASEDDSNDDIDDEDKGFFNDDSFEFDYDEDDNDESLSDDFTGDDADFIDDVESIITDENGNQIEVTNMAIVQNPETKEISLFIPEGKDDALPEGVEVIGEVLPSNDDQLLSASRRVKPLRRRMNASRHTLNR